MSALISLTVRRLPRNVLKLGMQEACNEKVKSACLMRQFSRLTVVAQNQVASGNEVPKRCSAQRAILCFDAQGLHTTSNLWTIQTVKTPPFPESVAEGDIKFTVKVGDYVTQDQVVMEVETDKTAMPVPAPFAGVIKEILVEDGSTVKAGQELFKLEKAEGTAPTPAAAPAAAATPPTPPKPAATTAAAPPTGNLGAIQTVKTPPFPESVAEGDVKFTVKVGDFVAQDQVVMEVETDKTAMPVPAPFAGVIKEILVAEGSTVKAGQELFKIAPAEGGTPSAAAAATPSPPPTPSSPKPAAAPAAAVPTPRPPPPPAARPPPPPPKPAAPAGKIPSASIPPRIGVPPAQAALQIKAPPTDYSRQITGTRTEQRVKMNRMRLKIAARLKDAQNTNAMLTTFNEIDMSAAMEFRKANLEAFQKKYGIKLGFMSIFSKASAYALQDQPVVNAVIDGQEIVYRDYVDISVAVATPKGLVVPVIRNVESMNYADVEIALAALGDKAKRNAISIEDMDGGTFTISNGGVFGSLMGTPIINPPQSAILGMHGIFERPVAVKGQVVIRPMMYVALTYDHRLIDGREAVVFLRKIKAAVEDPRIMLAGL